MVFQIICCTSGRLQSYTEKVEKEAIDKLDAANFEK